MLLVHRVVSPSFLLVSRRKTLHTHAMDTAASTVTLRKPSKVMQLKRLGSLHQSRLSFMRILTRRMKAESWRLSKVQFNVDKRGVGFATYSLAGRTRTYTLVAFAHDLPSHLRSDRVIATAWDATFTLFDGEPTETDIKRLANNVPYQEAGRLLSSELTLARANRSVRLWEHVVTCLSEGRQPELGEIENVGYLMRTTAVYGSGKFGALDHKVLSQREELSEPFQVEMITVYLIRTFVRDLVQHMARCKGGENAVKLESSIAQRLGIGNSTGLGMAPFLINHPDLLNNWLMAREEGLARVRNQNKTAQEKVNLLLELLQLVNIKLTSWHTDHDDYIRRIHKLKADIQRLTSHIQTCSLTDQSKPWDKLYTWAESHLGIEGQEYLVSLLLEIYPEEVDGLSCCLSASGNQLSRLDGQMPLATLKSRIESQYSWAIAIDWEDEQNTARAWYVSEEKLEPRLGERYQENIQHYEQPLSPARDITKLYQALCGVSLQGRVASFVNQYPEHRFAILRVQQLYKLPYGEIRNNTIGAELVPLDMLRAKLACFGATNFDPRSDRWLRICLFANAPYPEDIETSDADRWVYAPTGHTSGNINQLTDTAI